MLLFVAGAVFGDVGETSLLLRALSYVMRINHGSHFPWQAQQSVIL